MRRLNPAAMTGACFVIGLTLMSSGWSAAAQNAPVAGAPPPPPQQPAAPIPEPPAPQMIARAPSDCGVWRYVQDLSPPKPAASPQPAGAGSASGAPQGPAGGTAPQGAGGGKEGAGAQAGGSSPTGAGAALAAAPLSHVGPWVCAAWKDPQAVPGRPNGG